MSGKDKQEELMMRYLLGQATDEERGEIEERFLSDNDYFEDLLAMEDALVDEYVLGRMPPGRSEVFKANLTATQRENVEFTSKLVHELMAPPAAEKKTVEPLKNLSASAPVPGHLLAGVRFSNTQIALAALLVIVVVGLPMLVWNLTLKNQRDQAQEQIATVQEQIVEMRQTLETTKSELDRERATSSEEQNRLATLLANGELDPADIKVVPLDETFATRGSGDSMTAIELKENTRLVRFDVALDQPSGFPSYEVTVSAIDQQTVQRFPDLRPRAGKISISMIAADLSNGDYILAVRGKRDGRETDVESRSFRLQKSPAGQR